MRKLLAVLMAFAMVMGLGMTSFAATTDKDGLDNIVGTRDDKGSIQVYGIEEANLTTVKAYPIVLADYDDNDVFAGYETEYTIADVENPTKAELDAIAAVVTGGTTMLYNADGKYYYLDDLAVGMYLIVIPATETTTYNVAVASVYYTNEDGTQNGIVEGTTAIKAVATQPVWAKKDKVVDIEKTVNDEVGVSANVGDTLRYELIIDEMPSYTGSNPTLYVTDVMSEGLTYNEDAKVYVGETELVEGTNYTVSFNEETNTLTVNFVIEEGDAKVYNNNAYAGLSATIEYTAVLNENAVRNDAASEVEGNDNTVEIYYTNDSHYEGDIKDNDDTVYVYTFDATNFVMKVNENDEALEGAKFELYTKDAEGNKEVYSNAFHKDDKGRYVVASNAEGKLELIGLKAGTYYLQEIEAPDGYSVNTHEYTIVVTENYGDDEQLSSWTVTVDGADSVRIPNTRLASLPSTGGIGTTIFTIGGCVIMVAAAYMYFVSRRKEEQ